MLVNRLRPRPSDDDRGAALVTVIIVALALIVITASLSTAVVNTTRTTANVRGSLQSQAAADAGIADAVATVKKGGDFCGASPSPTPIPGTGVVKYSYTIECGGDTVTLTATGDANGSKTTVRAVYGLEAETVEQVDPSKTPVGLVIYDGSTMRDVTLIAHGGNEPQIVSITGPFGCNITIPGNLLVGGDITSSGACNVKGDVYIGGNVLFTGGGTTVSGDILAAGAGTSSINSAVGVAGAPLSNVKTNGPVDLTWSRATFRANLVANGSVTIRDRVVQGSVTLPSSETPSIQGGAIQGGVTKSSSIPSVSAPSLPGWFDYRFKAADWPGAATITLRNVNTMAPDTCKYFNENGGAAYANQGWKDLAKYTGTVVVDGRACTQLTSNAGGNPNVVIKATNVVLLAKKFNTTGLTMRSASGANPKVYFITEDTVADAKPTCPLGATAASFEPNGANLDGVRSLIYTPCRLSVSGGGVLVGSLYTNGFTSGGPVTIKGELMSLPGMAAPDGGYGGTPVVVETGKYALGELLTRQDVAP